MTDSRLDSYLFQGRGVGEQEPFLGAGGGENLELEGLAGRHIDELAVLELIAGLFQQLQRRDPPLAVLAGADPAAVRRLFTSFGSCSISDPVADLRGLGMLDEEE